MLTLGSLGEVLGHLGGYFGHSDVHSEIIADKDPLVMRKLR